MASAVIGALRVNLGIDTAAFSDGLTKANARLASFGKAMKVGLVAAGAAATAAIGGMGMAVKGTIDAADEMAKASKAIGVPIEELSRLRYAADLSGVSFQSLQNGVKRLSMNMSDALAGTGEGAKAFEQLGISVTGADGKLKSSSAVMQEIADKFAAMPDGAEKTALAMRLFGKAGADMIPLLTGGSEALGNLMNEADRFGQVFTEKMGAQAEQFNDNMSRLKGAFANVAAEIAQRVLPYLAQFSDWLVANAPAIGNVIASVFEFAASLVKLGTDAVSFVTGAWAQFNAGWDATVRKVHEVISVIQAFPGQVITALSEIGAQMYQLGVDMIDGLWRGIQSKWQEVKQGIYDIPGNIRDSFRNLFQIRSPSRVMMAIGQDVMAGFNIGMESMQGQTENLAQSIGSTIGSAFKGVIDGSKSVKDALIEVGLQILKTIAQMQMARTFGGGGGGFLGSLFSGLFGFANGGSFKVGGSGGIDSQLVAFKASPNERVTVTKPGQMIGSAASSVTQNFHIDARGAQEGVAEQIRQALAQAAPGIVSQSVAAVGSRARTNPGYLR